MKLKYLLIFLIYSILGLFFIISFAVADEDSKEDNGNQESTTSKDPGESDFSWSLGFGFIASPRPYKDTNVRYFPVPVLGFRYKRIFFEGIRGGIDIVEKGKLKANLFAQVRFRGLEPDDSPFLEGMNERRKSIDAGTQVVYQGRPVGFRFGFVSDVLGRSNGQEKVSLL